MDPPPVRGSLILTTNILSYLIPVIPGMDNSYYTTTTHSQMEYACPNNTNESNVVYHRNRTGPNYFRVYYKNAAYIRMTPKQVGAVFGVARFTPSVNEMRDWCYEMVKQYGSSADKTDDGYLNYIAKHGFGPEVHEEPNDNTKMVV